ncbi:MAG: ABC transporter ATP-binding protein [Bacteroidota bacterium]
MISIHNIVKSYKGVQVLNIDSLEIKAGEKFGLVGNNGAGKTTLFSLLLDLIQPDQGQVLSKDTSVMGSQHWKAYTGAYLDENFLIGFLLPEEYFKFVGKLRNMNKADVDAFLQQFEAFFNGEVIGTKKYIRDLSKGNQKKVGIAAALMGNTETVILDEPFANLDPSSQLKLRKVIQNLPEEMTVVISSHDLTHVAEVCKRIVVLEKGKMVKDIAATERTLEELESYFTAEVQ